MRSWNAAFLEQGCPQKETGCRVVSVTVASVLISAAAAFHHQSPGTAPCTLWEVMLELAGALGQAPCKTCRSGISETFPSNSISFPLKTKTETKEPILCKDRTWNKRLKNWKFPPLLRANVRVFWVLPPSHPLHFFSGGPSGFDGSSRNRAGSLAMGNLFPQVRATESVRGTAVPSSMLNPSFFEALFQEVLIRVVMITTFISVGGCVQSIHTVHSVGLCMLLEHRVPMYQEPSPTDVFLHNEHSRYDCDQHQSHSGQDNWDRIWLGILLFWTQKVACAFLFQIFYFSNWIHSTLAFVSWNFPVPICCQVFLSAVQTKF